MDEQSRSGLADSKETSPCQWEEEDFINLICTRCKFFKADEERLECAAFKILVDLLKSEVVTVGQIRKGGCGE